MPEKGAKTGCGNEQSVVGYSHSDEYRNQTLQAIADQGEKSGFFPRYSQHIGGPWIVRAFASRVGKAQDFAENDCRRQGTQQVSQ